MQWFFFENILLKLLTKLKLTWIHWKELSKLQHFTVKMLRLFSFFVPNILNYVEGSYHLIFFMSLGRWPNTVQALCCCCIVLQMQTVHYWFSLPFLLSKHLCSILLVIFLKFLMQVQKCYTQSTENCLADLIQTDT